MKDAMFVGPIVGHERVLLDERGPGALDPMPLASPPSTTAAQWAKHVLNRAFSKPQVCIGWHIDVTENCRSMRCSIALFLNLPEWVLRSTTMLCLVQHNFMSPPKTTMNTVKYRVEPCKDFLQQFMGMPLLFRN